jgi:hypothetical protein
MLSIHIVAQEQIVRLGRISFELKQSEKVIILTSHIAMYPDRSLQLEKNWLTEKNLSRLRAKRANLALRKADFCTWP